MKEDMPIVGAKKVFGAADSSWAPGERSGIW